MAPIDFTITDKPKSQKEWQAEDDAHTLARAEAIRADSSRHQAAKSAAQKMLDDEREDVRLLSKVAGRRAPRKQSGGTATSGGGGFNVGKRI